MIHLTVERVKSFLSKRPNGAKRVMLGVETPGSGTPTPCGEWEREEIEDEQDPVVGHTKIAEAIVEAGQEAADAAGEPCKAMLAWVMESGRPLRTITTRVMPDDESNEAALEATGKDPSQVDTNRLVEALLQSLTAAYKAQNAATGITLQAYERALAMQQRMIDTLSSRMGEHLLPATSGDSAEVQTLKAKALEKLVEMGPAVGNLALKALAASLSSPAVPGAPIPPINGSS